MLRFTHAPLQADSPVGHWHVPEVQVAPVAQRVPHSPQFASSVWRYAQIVGVAGGRGQTVVPDGQAQAPETHASFVSGQAVVHAAGPFPQWLASVWPSTQRGFRASQYVYPPHAQVPAAHVPSGPQRIPHPPQFEGSVWYDAVSTQTLLQTSCPAGHRQVPDAQAAPEAQAFAQLPQLSRSEERSAQVPRQAV